MRPELWLLASIFLPFILLIGMTVVAPVAVPVAQTIIKPLSWLKINPQVRTVVDEEADRYLTESIREHGVLQPPGALQDGTLIFGHRRVRCAIAAGLREILFFILTKPMTETEIKILQLTENIHRADLTGAEKWKAAVGLLTLNPEWSQKNLAHHLKLNEGMITKLLSPSKCVLPVQEAFLAGKLTVSDCYQISKNSEIEQIEALAMKLNGEITSREGLAAHRQKRNGHAEKPEEKVSRIKLALPGGALVTVAAEGEGEGMTLSAIIDHLKAVLSACFAAQKDGTSARALQLALKDKASKPTQAKTES